MAKKKEEREEEGNSNMGGQTNEKQQEKIELLSQCNGSWKAEILHSSPVIMKE